uniref:KH-type splicing regulatory protein n=1 Tax=Maylandia zebra TaxID=106582 RepID=A0A3P9DBR9_9CICH
LLLVFQIAAKIGGDAGPPVNNSTAPDSFPFTAQKRQLEDTNTGDCTFISLCDYFKEYSVPDSMVGLIIGRGGEQINKIQQESGCKVQIAPDSGGLPERNVSLTGTQDSIQKAKRLLNEIVSRGRVHEMMIPAGKAGLVIGKGGETIKQLQERAGVKMILIQDASQGPNVDKPLRIIGDPYKVQQAQEMVQEILRDRDQGGYSERSEFSSRMGGGMDIPVPRHSVGVVIGRNGEMIKKIQNDAGVRIQFKQDDGTGPDKIAHISGPPERCEHAAQIINDLLQSIRVREEGQGGPPGPPGMRLGSPGGEMTFSIPAQKCGLVIGRGGENVKSINQQTGAFVEISRQPPPNGDPNFKLFIIRGSPQQIDHAKQLIEEKIEWWSSRSSQYSSQGWSNTYQQWQPQPPHDPNPGCTDTGGQPDYTKAWEEYYKKMGTSMLHMLGSNLSSTTGGQQDYSAAWAEYYRQQAAYYGQTGQQPSGQPANPSRDRLVQRPRRGLVSVCVNLPPHVSHLTSKRLYFRCSESSWQKTG